MKRYNIDVEIVENNRKPEYISCVELINAPTGTRVQIFRGRLYMTKKDIIMWHRKMWTWIAVQHYMGSKESVTALKAEFLIKHHFNQITALCFLCEQANVFCEHCLVQWPHNEPCYTGLYHELQIAFNRIDKSRNYRPYRFLALKELEIAMLPARKEAFK